MMLLPPGTAGHRSRQATSASRAKGNSLIIVPPGQSRVVGFEKPGMVARVFSKSAEDLTAAGRECRRPMPTARLKWLL